MRDVVVVVLAVAATAVFVWKKRRRQRPPQLKYGTAGFRADAKLLWVAMERVGILAAIRGGGKKATGVMVTASHNPERDNGCKIVDTDGGMLAEAWEGRAEELARAPEAEVRVPRCDDGVVVVGRDTRRHSRGLADRVKRGVARTGARVLDVGVVTTPQLHHCVRELNEGAADASDLFGYYRKLVEAYNRIVPPGTPTVELCVDCAGGVGALAVEKLRGLLNGLELVAVNRVGDVELNRGCGAEFVQKERKPPRNYDPRRRFCCIDGDADRLVYCYGRDFRVLDGDKIAALLASYLGEYCRVGCVQTAYANGASTAYLSTRVDSLATAKTGVKHVHAKAADIMDVGIYFEPNGHGTVLFNNAKSPPERLAPFASLANQCVGDAIADALLVEAVLKLRNWSLEDWDAIYDDLPSRQLKQKIPDRALLVPDEETESRLLHPETLQLAIDDLVSKTPRGRAFVRPSGTEDVVRIYAEAASQPDADALARACQRAVADACGGGGGGGGI
ncbi:hypothetical protein CTAYLR_006918 [Chrysophaeum taylorii]|uniref:Phosphoacetylglucosamine mutase n=1 Tax=Chrysophaeum taylorii TaxID=2483200 RepID=A0AAD7XJH7_9STRA|nr:hypothetical protein CTAYLR_006918 [Chrysophaeum taylorii]